MRFTRKLPGIRPPLPGREDEAGPPFELLPPGGMAVLVYVFLLAFLGIYLFCTLRFGGQMSLFWLETKVAGLSLHALATLVNALLFLAAALAYFTARRSGRHRSWKRTVGFLFALGLLVCTQVYLEGWRSAATRDRENALARIEEGNETVAGLRREIERLDERSWGGEYVTNLGGWNVRLLLAPGHGACQVWTHRESDPGAPVHERYSARQVVPSGLEVERGRLVLELSMPRGPRPTRFAVVDWGERRYLIEEDRLEEFLSGEGEPPDDRGILLRVGDEGRPLTGRPSVRSDLR